MDQKSTANVGLITSEYINQLLQDASMDTQHREITIGGFIEGFFNKLSKNKKNSSVDFSKIDDIGYLTKLKGYLLEFREKTIHKYKKMHYTYLISKVMDRMIELTHFGGRDQSFLNKINHIIHPGDVMLISYHSKGFSWDSILNNMANNLLRFFSKSIFAHIGIIGKHNEKTGYERIHSTLHTDGGRRGVKSTSLNAYLKKNHPCEVLLLRYASADTESNIAIAEQAYRLEKNTVDYDAGAAIGDISGFDFFRAEEKINCGELVFSCLQSLDPSIDISQKAIPAAYLEVPSLEQIYLATYTGS